jgi:uncharacterized paraquat-inducible protein A
MGSNEKKSATLGMPHGTATHRLRKMVLFSVLKRHNEAVCFKCGKEIGAVEDLSIEHKKPWEGISAELFWDLENIAFSHIQCNRPHTNWGGANRKTEAPEGQAWCSSCGLFKSKTDFSTHAKRWNGVDTECKKCKDARNKQRDRKRIQGDVGIVVERHLAKV